MSTVNALVVAARDGDVRQIKALAKQCDVNAKDELGWCAVHRAAVHGQVASLRCLVANGADLDAVDDSINPYLRPTTLLERPRLGVQLPQSFFDGSLLRGDARELLPRRTLRNFLLRRLDRRRPHRRPTAREAVVDQPLVGHALTAIHTVPNE